MNHVNRFPNGDSIHCAVGSAFIIDRNFHHAAAETMQRLRFGAHFAQLNDVQRIADIVLDASRNDLSLDRESANHLSSFIHLYMPILA